MMEKQAAPPEGTDRIKDSPLLRKTLGVLAVVNCDVDKQRKFFESLGMPELGFCLPPERYRFFIADLLGEITPEVFPLLWQKIGAEDREFVRETLDHLMATLNEVQQKLKNKSVMGPELDRVSKIKSMCED